MKRIVITLQLALGLLFSSGLSAQSVATEPRRMSVNERMEKARAAKMAKKAAPNTQSVTVTKSERATAADYRTPVIKSEKGPNGEAVHVGDRGGKFYINKNGNKTYLSSNQ